MISAGLSLPKKSGNGIYDRFRNRMMIPIADLYGNVVAFGGRIIEDKSTGIDNHNNEFEQPKYINTSETLVFNKGKMLFGLNTATAEIKRLDYVIVVEGYMDVISVASAGIKNVVASLGTAFTVDQAKLLLRYTKNIMFCYDSDEAGQKATLRALPIAANLGAEIKIIVVPDGKDPDEFIRNHGIDEFKILIKDALPLIDYRIGYVLSNTAHDTIDGKINALRQIIPILINIKDNLIRTAYRKKISAALLIEDDVINAELNKMSKTYQQPAYDSMESANKPLKKAITPVENIKDKSLWTASRIIIKTAWNDSDTLYYTLSIVPEQAFPQVHQEIIKYLKECFEQEQHANDITAAEQLSEEAMAEISKLLMENESESFDSVQAYKDSIRTMKIKWLQLCYANIIKQIKEISISDPNYMENPEYMKKMQESLVIKKEMDDIKFF
ncbi:MAG: toprim domain-containing protein [Selenomonadaceae bacterium]|nr:toprim domain-containing protein [Selenomonadaceae bacterium]